MENQTVNNNDEVEIDLGEVFHLLLSKLGVIILSGIVFCLAAVMGTMLLITPKYESTTKIVVLSKQDSSTLTNQDIQTSTSLTKDYAELIKSRTVTEGVIAQLKLDMTHEELLKKLSVDTPTDTRVVSITVTDTDPYTAAEIANAVRDIASKHIQQVMDIKAVNVVETANIPDEPSSPSVRMYPSGSSRCDHRISDKRYCKDTGRRREISWIKRTWYNPILFQNGQEIQKEKETSRIKITTTDQSVGKGREQQKYEEIFCVFISGHLPWYGSRCSIHEELRG